MIHVISTPYASLGGPTFFWLWPTRHSSLNPRKTPFSPECFKFFPTSGLLHLHSFCLEHFAQDTVIFLHLNYTVQQCVYISCQGGLN